MRAQGKTTIEFYFPVAVGGPITKIIDGYAADFMNATTPTSRVSPIYAGSYVDTLTKAVTATKAGKGPQLAVLLAVDAYSLIDDDLIVPFDTSRDERTARRGWPASTRRSCATARSTGTPGACRSSAPPSCCTGTRSIFREAGLDPEHAAREPGTEHAEFARENDQA